MRVGAVCVYSGGCVCGTACVCVCVCVYVAGAGGCNAQDFVIGPVRTP